MRQAMNSFDIAAIILELKRDLIGKHVDNIYHIDRNLFAIKMSPGQDMLLLEIGRRINLTKFAINTPKIPSNFCRSLRKFLRNQRILDISQPNFERIVFIKVATKAGPYTLVAELLPRGNLVLVGPDNRIITALFQATMRDRVIRKGEPFILPPTTLINPLEATRADLERLLFFGLEEAGKAVTKLLSTGRTYAEELLLRAGIDMTKPAASLEAIELDKLYEAIQDFKRSLEEGRFEPCLYHGSNGEPVDVAPFSLRILSQFGIKQYPSFNEASDEYFTRLSKISEEQLKRKQVDERIKSLQRILKTQSAKLVEFRIEANRYNQIGDIIFSHMGEIEELRLKILNSISSKESLHEVLEEIKDKKAKGKSPEAYFTGLEIQTSLLHLTIDDIEFSVKLQRPCHEEAARYYSHSKKIQRKIVGLEKSMQEIQDKLSSLDVKLGIHEAELPLLRRVDREWYEKFHWFHSSEGLLVIGGRDASSNELLLKKYMDPGDIVVHAEIHGAPFFLIKSGNKMPSEDTLFEAAQAAASYSRAWKDGLSSLDVYWVLGTQVKKAPPSGEYLPRGAFAIRGKRNYIKHVALRLAVGIDLKSEPPRVIGGPPSSVKKLTTMYFELGPGTLNQREIAEMLATRLSSMITYGSGPSLVNPEEIQRFLPSGRSQILGIARDRESSETLKEVDRSH